MVEFASIQLSISEGLASSLYHMLEFQKTSSVWNELCFFDLITLLFYLSHICLVRDLLSPVLDSALYSYEAFSFI